MRQYIYSRTPLIRPPSESHWCGRIRGMVAREGFVYEQKPLQVRHTKCGRMRGMVIGEGGRSSGVLLYIYTCNAEDSLCSYVKEVMFFQVINCTCFTRLLASPGLQCHKMPD